MNKIGIMQGRLSPRYNGRYQSFPLERWQSEFRIAASLGFDCIEFIYDSENYEKSPLVTDDGLKEVKRIADETGVGVFSVCADYFMKFPLFDSDKEKRLLNIRRLNEVITKSAAIGVRDITVPCVDASSLKTSNDIENLKSGLALCLKNAESHEVNINLETDLRPANFCKLIKELDHPKIKINYDTGNSASLGYNPEEEFNLYGKYISVLHIKDRVYKGGSVKLGTGKVSFELVFRNLKKIGFKGVFIMQAARAEEYSHEVEFVREQLSFVKDCFERWY